jgi:hypothetical protein
VDLDLIGTHSNDHKEEAATAGSNISGIESDGFAFLEIELFCLCVKAIGSGDGVGSGGKLAVEGFSVSEGSDLFAVDEDV